MEHGGGSGVAIWRRVGWGCAAWCLQCAMHRNAPRYENHLEFSLGVASLRGSTGSLRSACNAFAGVQRGETRIAGGREGEKKERMVEKVLSNAVVPPSVLRNTIISVTSLTVVSFEYPRVGRFDRIILRGIEPRSVISCSGAYVQTVRGEERYRTELFHDS